MEQLLFFGLHLFHSSALTMALVRGLFLTFSHSLRSVIVILNYVSCQIARLTKLQKPLTPAGIYSERHFLVALILGLPMDGRNVIC